MGGPPISSNLNEAAARRLAAGRTATTTGRPAGLSVAGAAPGSSLSSARSPVSPSSGSTATPSPGAGSQTQHEVLHNFFQSLLSTKDRPQANASNRSSPAKPNGTTNGVEEGSS